MVQKKGSKKAARITVAQEARIFRLVMLQRLKIDSIRCRIMIKTLQLILRVTQHMTPIRSSIEVSSVSRLADDSIGDDSVPAAALYQINSKKTTTVGGIAEKVKKLPIKKVIPATKMITLNAQTLDQLYPPRLNLSPQIIAMLDRSDSID